MESVVLAVAQNGFNTIKQPAAQRFTVKCDVLAKLIEEVHYMGSGGGMVTQGRLDGELLRQDPVSC